MSSKAEAEVRKLLASLDLSAPYLKVLRESALALASEIDDAGVPDEKGRTRSAAPAVRALRDVLGELQQLAKPKGAVKVVSKVDEIAERRAARNADAADPAPGSRRGQPRRRGRVS